MENKEKIREKHHKQAKYLKHPELIQLQGLFPSQFSLIFILISIFLFTVGGYPKPMAAYDFSFAVVAVIFMKVIFPQMLKGNITAYYRRSYSGFRYILSLTMFFTAGAVIRGIYLVLVLLFKFYQSNGVSISSVQWFIGLTFHPGYNLLGAGMALFLIYKLFYDDRFATIKDTSNGVFDLMTKSGMRYNEAFSAYTRLRDRQLGIKSHNGVKYEPTDIIDEIRPPSYKEMEERREQEELERKTAEQENTKKTETLDIETENIRRTPRKKENI